MTDTKRTRTALGLVAAAALLTLAACGNEGDDPASAASSDEPTSQESTSGQPEPALDDVPDVVAEVNGEQVTKEEFVAVYEAQLQQASTQAQMGGQQPDEEALKKQTAENLVDTELLAQEAESRGLTVTDQDVDDELADVAKQNQMSSADELLAALEKQGTSEDQARSQLETQLVIEQLVDDEAGPVKPTERELRTLYTRAKKQQEQMAQQGGQQQAVPPFEKVRSQLEEQATQEQVGKVAQKLVDELRQDADITINL